MKRSTFFVVLLLICSLGWAQQQKPRPVKNVILMIPDGTSIGVVSAARWYKIYNQTGNNLNIDPYFCGTVKTHSSNAPIGDSAPTTSCYMTGIPQRTGNVSIYPVADPGNDLFPINPEMAYQPLATILEAARIDRNKATGLVVTVEFPHATPADCAAHYYKRSKYDYIASQMVYNHLDVMFGGGNKILTEDMKQYFTVNETTLIQNDVNAFRNYSEDNKVWALFCDMEHPYDLDRDPDEVPSLEEMTRKAIERLSKNDNGFFLMVEGSKIDWTAHSNDAIGCITEFLAFDRTVGAAMEFAREDGETAVIILPDHGNSGFTIGRKDLKKYDEASIEELFGNVSKYKRTAEGLEKILLDQKPENFKSIVKQYTDIDITDEEMEALVRSKNYKHYDYTKVGEEQNMVSVLTHIMNRQTWFGFTSYGHTGEEVFLAAYHPQGDIPIGMRTNVQINQYLFDVLGIQTSLPDLTRTLFAEHTGLFSGMEYKIDTKKKFPVLTVKNGKNILEVPAFKSIAYLNGTAIDLGSVTVYIDKNNMFYLPAFLREMVK